MTIFTFIIIAVSVTSSIMFFIKLAKLVKAVNADIKNKAEQPEQPEQNSPEPERPNVYYSKDIQIVSEPAYLTPPFRRSELKRMTVECLQGNVVLFSFFFNGNLVSIQISDNVLLNEIINFEEGKHQSEPLILAKAYLMDKKILK